jgi:putative transposase
MVSSNEAMYNEKMNTLDNTLQVEEIAAAMKRCKDRRMFERYQAIKLYLTEKTVTEISEIIGRSLPTVYSYINSYRKNGIEGLAMKPPPGRPSLLSEEQKQLVYDLIINQTPEGVGFRAEMNWTSPLVRCWIKQEWGIEYSDRGMRALMYALNLSYTRPTYTLKKADPVKQEDFKKIPPIREAFAK